MIKYAVKITGTGSAGFNGSSLTIESGRPVYVNGFILSAVTAATITMANGAGTTIVTFNLGANSTVVSHTKFLADAGLSFSSNQTDSSAIVFHSQAGA